MWSVVKASKSDINESAMVAPNAPESPIKLMAMGTMGASDIIKSNPLQMKTEGLCQPYALSSPYAYKVCEKVVPAHSSMSHLKSCPKKGFSSGLSLSPAGYALLDVSHSSTAEIESIV
jgi:hypothetical protein